jgi:hypothetical protein
VGTCGVRALASFVVSNSQRGAIMKKTHRNVHRIAWLLLLPTLLGFVYFAQQGKPAKAPTVETAPHPSKAGELP